ncbi:hypothetical protein FB451DRAFT_1256302 [Mycena latifolia]|nr:hypothetical protein FB451DRAFT_1256302 [Mycena latifolia]
MPSTTRGTPGEVRRPTTASSTSHPSPTHFHLASSLPPFRPRQRLIPSSKPPSKTLRRLRFIVLHRRPPRSLHAACARFRLARKKSPSRQFDNATAITTALEQLETRAQHIFSQIQTIHDLLEATQNLIHKPTRIQLIFPTLRSQFDPTPPTQPSVRIGYPLDRSAAGVPLSSPPAALGPLPRGCDYVIVTQPVTRPTRSPVITQGARKSGKSVHIEHTVRRGSYLP